MTKIFSYAKKYKSKVYVSIVLATLGVFAGMIPYYLVYRIIMAFTGASLPSVKWSLLMSVLILLCLVMRSTLYFSALTASHEAAFDILLGLRQSIAEKMIKMPIGEIQKRKHGEYKSTIVDLIDDMELILAHIIPEGISNALVPILVILYLFVIDYRMAILALINIPIGMFIYSKAMKKAAVKLPQQIHAFQSMNATMVEFINGIKVIKIFNQTTSSFQKYTASVKNYKKFVLDWYKESWRHMALLDVLVPCTVLFVLPFGTFFYVQGSLSLSNFLLCVLLSIGLGTPVNKLSEFTRSFRFAMEKSKQIELLLKSEELEDKGNTLIPKSNDIEFENICFAYEKKEVLSNVTFTVEANTVTALVGVSGSGKSTIVKLLLRFWDIKSGSINIGGINIKDMAFDTLMGQISYVSQDIYLFNTTIIDNIRMGNPDATDEEVINAARLAQCHEFIMALEDGYQTLTGDTGKKLSGGQKQRISIARAILKDAPIILLDEATTFTDPENEDKIQESLNGLIGGKTLIVIAHRLSTIVGANQILLMDKGKIVARGTHEFLLECSELYDSMWKAHTEAMEWDVTIRRKADVQDYKPVV